MKFNGQSKESKYLTATLSGYRVFLRYLGFLLFLLPCFVRADVYINEINFNPIGNQNQEWIEIYNSGPDAVDLTGYWLEDRVQWNYYFPVGQTLGAGDYLIVHIGIGVDGPNNVYMGYTTGRLNNSGAELVMRNSANSAIDYVAYGTGSFDPLLGWTNNVNIVGLPPGPTIGFTGTNPATRNNGNNWSSGPHTVGKPNIAPTATIRMNEILPEPGDGHEFFEIYHSGTGNLRDYRLSTGSNSVNDLLLPFYPFTGTGYIVVYLQDLPVDAPPNSVALNLAANRLANAGDSATLRTNFNNSVAAVVAYNSATSGFSPSISTAAPYQSGDSFAFLEVTGNTSTNGNQWINRRGANISAGEVNSEQPAPSIEFGTPDPDGVLGSCQAVTIPLEILYENESWLREVTVTFDLNAIAVTGGDVLFGDFDGGEVGSAYHSGDRVMTWQIGNLTADRDDLAITLIPGTNVTAFTIPPEAVTLTYHRWPGSGAPGTTSPSGPLAEITVNTPALSVEVTEFNTGNPVHSARNGQFVDLRIRVTNSGTGNLPGGSAEINLGSNLRLITVRENNATGPTPPAYSSSPQDGGWDLAAIPAGEFKEYYARVRLAGCLDLNVDVFVFSGCAEGGGNSNDNVVDTSYTIVCPLTVTYTLPTAGVTACEDFEYVINIANSSIFDAQLGNIVIQIPDSFYFMEARDATDNLLDVPGFDGDYDGTVSGGFRTITIQSDSFLAGGILQEANTSIVNGVLVGSPTSTHITLVLRGTCEPASDQKISNQFTYDLGPLNLPVSFETKGVTTDLPVLSVQISDPDDAMNTTVLASRGQEVNFLLEVLNNGSGDLDFSDDPDGALAEIVNVAAGLQIIGVYEGAPVDSETPPAGPNLIDPGNGDFDWRTGPIGSGDKNSYTVRLRVISCNLISFGAQVSYECSGRPDIAIDTCEVPPSFATSAAASIEIELNAPLVNMILPADLEVDYCPENPAANTFEIPFENNGTGPATSLTVEVDGLDLTHYDIQVAANSDFELTTIIGDIAIFTLVDGVDADFDGNTDDLPVDETRFLRFYLELKDNGDGCAAATGGNAMVLVLYGDLCGFEFLGEIDFFDWNLNPRIWSGSLTAAVSQPNPHPRGASGTLTYEFNYTGVPGADVAYTFTVNIPVGGVGEFQIDEVRVDGVPVTTPADYSYDAFTGELVFNQTGLFDGVWGQYESEIEIDYTAPENACGNYTFAAVANWGLDCIGCPLPSNGIQEQDIVLMFGNQDLGSLVIDGPSGPLDPGDEDLVYTVTVNYLGEAGGPFAYDLAIDVGDFIVSAVDSAYTLNGSIIEIEIAGASFNASGVYARVFEITLDAPSAPVCEDSILLSAALNVTDDQSLCVSNPDPLIDTFGVDIDVSPTLSSSVNVSGPQYLVLNATDESFTVEVDFNSIANEEFSYDLVINIGNLVLEEIDGLNAGVDYTYAHPLITIPVENVLLDGAGNYNRLFDLSLSAPLDDCAEIIIEASAIVTDPGVLCVDPSGNSDAHTVNFYTYGIHNDVFVEIDGLDELAQNAEEVIYTIDVSWTDGEPSAAHSYTLLIDIGDLILSNGLASITRIAGPATSIDLSNLPIIEIFVDGVSFDGNGHFSDQFEIEVDVPDPFCEETEISASLVNPGNTCPGSLMAMDTLTITHIPITGLLEIDGPDTLDPDSEEWYTVEIDYIGEEDGEFSYELTIEIGDFELLEIADLLENVDYTIDNQTILIPIESAFFNEDGEYVRVFDIHLKAPSPFCEGIQIEATSVIVDPCPDSLFHQVLYAAHFTAPTPTIGELTIDGPTPLNQGDQDTYMVEVDYTGAVDATFSYELVVDVGVFEVVSITGLVENTDYTVDGQEVIIPVTGSFDGDGEYNRIFDFVLKAPDLICTNITILASSTITDPCAGEHGVEPTTEFDVVFPTTPEEIVSLELNGGGVITAGFNGNWDIEITYLGIFNGPLEYELVIEYPEYFIIDAVTHEAPPVALDPSDYSVDTINRIITIPVVAAFDGTGLYEGFFSISYTALPEAEGGPYPITATMTVTEPANPMTNTGCPVAAELTDTIFTSFPQLDEYDLVGSHRRATYLNINSNGNDNSDVDTEGEVCTDVRLTTLFEFADNDAISWSGMTFTDVLTGGLLLQDGNLSNLNLEVYYFESGIFPPDLPSGDNLVQPGVIELNSHVSYNAGNQTLIIDLSPLNALVGEPNEPGDGGVLWIAYDVTSSATTPVGAPFTETASLSLPPGGSAMPGLYSPSTDLTFTTSSPSVGFQRVDGGSVNVVDSCETITMRFPITTDKPWDLYDVRLVVRLGDINDAIADYEYVTGSVVFNDLVDGNGDPIAEFDPELSINGDVLTWNLGDLRGVQAGDVWVEMDLVKTCDVTSTRIEALLYSNSHCSNVNDAILDTLVPADFDNVTESTPYSPRQREGVLAVRWATELVYYTTGYPVLRFDVLNTGRGKLQNVRIPIELGDTDIRTLSFVSARIVKIDGAPGSIPGAPPLNVPLDETGSVRVVEVDNSNAGLNGDTAFELHIDEMGPSSILTITVRTRMHLDHNLEGRIVDATWGCDLDAGYVECNQASLPEFLSGTIEIRPATTRVEITSHIANPDILDFCGDETEVTIRLANVGGVQAYEPVLVETLPPGLKIIPNTVQIRINDSGPWVDFDQGTAAGGTWNTHYEINGNGQEVITWNFADPNDNNNELDFSYMADPAFDDPRPQDSNTMPPEFFNRGRVLKPGQSIQVRFQAAIDSGDCAEALAYFEGNRTANATVLFDLPANRDNNVDPVTFLPDPNRSPLENSSMVSNFLDPGRADLALTIVGENTAQNGMPTASRVNAEQGDSVHWTVTMESQSDGNIPEVVLLMEVPNTLAVVGSAPNFSFDVLNADISIADVVVDTSSIEYTAYTITFNNSNFDGKSYFGWEDTVELTFQTEIVSCTAVPVAVNGVVSFGCCDGAALGSPVVPGAFGFDIASTEVKTRPTLPTVQLFEGTTPGVDADDLTVCGGIITFIITNPDVNNELSLHDLRVELPLPSGFTYDLDTTVWSYSGMGARAPAEQTNHEPVLDGNTLYWTAQSNAVIAGNIPDAEAIIYPQETIEVSFYLIADGNCVTDPAQSQSVSSFAQPLNVFFADSCGTPLSRNQSTNMSPDAPNLNLSLSPAPGFITGSDTEIVWTVIIENNGSLDAHNVSLILDFADGYSGATSIVIGNDPNGAIANAVISTTEVSVDPLGPGGAVAHDIDIIFSDPLLEGQQYTFTVTRQINTVARDDLSAAAILRGECFNGCLYNYRFASGRVAGGELVKATDGLQLNDPAVGDQNMAGISGDFPVAPGDRFESSDLTIGSIVREVLRIEVYEGGSNDLEIVYPLPTGLRLLQANRVDSFGDFVDELDEAGNNVTGTLSFEIDNFTGGATGSDAIFVEVWLQVVNNISQNVADQIKSVPTRLNITRGSNTYTHQTYPAALSTQTQYTILEPYIRNEDQDKVSDPVSLADNHTPPNPLDTNVLAEIEYTFTAENTGSSPAYEVLIHDNIPFGLGDPTDLPPPHTLVLEIENRTLVLDVDYELTYTPGAGFGDAGLMTVQLLNTTDAVLGVGEILSLNYFAPILGGAPGSFIDNEAIVKGYTSLPGSGADVSIATSGGPVIYSEGDEERDEYASGDYRLIFPRYTYHFISGQLTVEKSVRATITAFDNGDPAGNFVTGNATRATIGEEVVYRIRLTIPPNIKIYSPEFLDTLPDGLTVTELRWELVNAGGDFTGGEQVIDNFSESGSGTTPIVLESGAAPTDFPDDLPNPGLPYGVGAVRDLLVEITVTVDQIYNNAFPLHTGDVFANWARFNWQTVTSVVESYSLDTNTVHFTVREPDVDFTNNGKQLESVGLGTDANFRNYFGEGPTSLFEAIVTDVPLFGVGATVTYSVEIENTGDTMAYEVIIQDLIPTGMTYVPGSATIVAGNSSFMTNPPVAVAENGSPHYSQIVQFELDEVDEGEIIKIEYDVLIDTPVAAGRYLQNKSVITDFTTLPGDHPDLERSVGPNHFDFEEPDPVFAAIGTPYPQILKTQDTELTVNGVTIGELITYTLEVNVDNDYTLPDFWLYDELADGLGIVDVQLVTESGFDTASADFVVGGRTVEVSATNPLGVVADPDLTVIVHAAVNQYNTAESIRVADVDGPVFTGGAITGFGNEFFVSWNQIKEDPDPVVNIGNSYLSGVDIRETLNDFASNPVFISVKEPDIDVFTKTQSNQTDGGRGTDNFYWYPASEDAALVEGVDVVLPDDVMRYTINVTNNGTAPAFDVTIVDVLPSKDFVTFVDQNTNGSIDVGDIDYSGSAGSILTVVTDPPAVVNIDEITFIIDFLLPGQSVEIEYEIQIDRSIGAALYIGPNTATLTDFSTLPSDELAVDVGNLANGEIVDDYTRRRSSGNPTPLELRYSTLDDGDDIGVQWPTFEKTVYRLFDEHGSLLGMPEEILPTDSEAVRRVRIGEVIRYELSVTLPPYTVLFGGGASGEGLILRDELPPGFKLRQGSEIYSYDTNPDLTGGFISRTPGHTGDFQQWFWRFTDIENQSNSEQEFVLTFEADVTNTPPNGGAPNLHMDVASIDNSVNRANHAWVFWETDDRNLGRSNANKGLATATGDHPSLAHTDSANVRVTQPNLTFHKRAYRFDPLAATPGFYGVPLASQELIGVTAGDGDVIVYEVEVVQQSTSPEVNSPAYEFEFTDRLPQDLRPSNMTAGADLDASDFVAYVTDGNDDIVQILVPNDDYQFSYDNATGEWTFTAIYNDSLNEYRSRVGLDQKLKLAYKTTLDPEVGAKGGGFGLRVNRAGVDYWSFPLAQGNQEILGSGFGNTDPTQPKFYDPADRSFALLLDTPMVKKAAYDDGTPAALPEGSSVEPGNEIVYRIAIPWGPIRASMYDVEIVDILPNGLILENGLADVEVVGVDGANVSINVSGVNNRNINITIDKIDASSGNVNERFGNLLEDGDFLNLITADINSFDDTAVDQAVVIIRATVSPTGQFDNGTGILRLHEFQNSASVFWHDAPDTNPDRNYYGVVSEFVSHFFNASGVIFEPNHTSSGIRGTVKTYPHRLRNFSQEAQDVVITWPESTRGWSWSLYLVDEDTGALSGPYLSGHTLQLPVRDLAVDESGTVDILFRAFVPSEEPPNATDILMVTATSPNAFFEPLQVVDVTTVTDGQVSIVKGISQSGFAGPYSTQVETRPDVAQRIWNELKVTNFSSQFIKEVFVYDFLPEHTQYIANSATTFGGEFELAYSVDNGVNWTIGEPADHLPTQSTSAADFIVPGVTNLRWKYIGDTGGRGAGFLEPGEEKVLYFQMRIR